MELAQRGLGRRVAQKLPVIGGIISSETREAKVER
jgi:hypothetical protein